MRPVLILNDVHLGVQRSAGTTPKTAAALKSYLLENLRTVMFAHLDKNIIINGDIFDQFNVPLNDVFDFSMLCRDWLKHSYDSVQLILSEGNHDLSKNSANMCSLSFAAKMLNSDRVELIEEATQLPSHRIYIIPHVANQDMFDLELEKAAELNGYLVLVHANYDNNFAAQSDHSLNVSAEQAKAIVHAGNTLLFGHEHQAKHPQPEVWVAGNQFPSSVADCLGNNSKHAFIFYPETRELIKDTTWEAEGSFAELEWNTLDQAGDFEFVRVVGDCPTEQAADMLAAISKYRQRSSAYVVTNAVSVAGVVAMSDLPSNLETVKGFDVLGFLFENLEPEQVKVVKSLMEKAND